MPPGDGGVAGEAGLAEDGRVGASVDVDGDYIPLVYFTRPGERMRRVAHLTLRAVSSPRTLLDGYIPIHDHHVRVFPVDGLPVVTERDDLRFWVPLKMSALA